jgi:hypothetical protein
MRDKSPSTELTLQVLTDYAFACRAASSTFSTHAC